MPSVTAVTLREPLGPSLEGRAVRQGHFARDGSDVFAPSARSPTYEAVSPMRKLFVVPLLLFFAHRARGVRGHRRPHRRYLRFVRPDRRRRRSEVFGQARHGRAQAEALVRSRERRPTADAAPAVPPQLQAIASCESGGNPTAVSAERHLPRQVPVLDRHVAGRGRQRRPRRRARGRAGQARGDALRAQRARASGPSAGVVLASRSEASVADRPGCPGTMSSSPDSSQRIQALWPPS